MCFRPAPKAAPSNPIISVKFSDSEDDGFTLDTNPLTKGNFPHKVVLENRKGFCFSLSLTKKSLCSSSTWHCSACIALWNLFFIVIFLLPRKVYAAVPHGIAVLPLPLKHFSCKIMLELLLKPFSFCEIMENFSLKYFSWWYCMENFLLKYFSYWIAY